MSNAQAVQAVSTEAQANVNMNDLTALCKRRGFIFAASEIYGGINGFWDYGPLGIALKNNLRDRWWRDMVIAPPMGPDGKPVQIVGLDSSIIQNPKAWEASGHVAGFSDPMSTCRQCKKLTRTDHLDGLLKEAEWVQSFADAMEASGFEHFIKFDSAKALKWAQTKGRKLAPGLAVVRKPEITLSWLAEDIQAKKIAEPIGVAVLLQYMATEQKNQTGLQMPCPHCGGDLAEPKQFNLMFKTYVGATATEDDKAYLRPETAQGIFLNFKNVVDSSRVRVPFGIAQVGKAFRNEVTPRNFIYRSREFEQMEMEWFCPPEEAKQWFDFWVQQRHEWWKSVGVSASSLKIRPHDKDELSHYAKAGHGTVDIEYKFPFTWPGFGELEGIAHRCDFDLTQHEKFSGVKMEYFDDINQKRFIPHVIEPASGLTRGVLAVLAEAYTADPSRPSGMYLKLKPSLAPVKAAILPLVNKDSLPDIAQKLYMSCRHHFMTELDVKQNIGKRYARNDEIGTPFCVTIDNDTLNDNAATIRHRDTMQQERVGLDHIRAYIADKVQE